MARARDRDHSRAGATGRPGAVVPIAFVSDHIETLHEQRILLAGIAKTAGIERYEVANAINDCRLYARALARLVRQALETRLLSGSDTSV